MLFNKKGYGGIPKTINFIVALIVLATGSLPLLSKFGFIGEIPSIPMIVMEIVTVIAGLLLILDGFIGSGENTTIMPKSLNLIMGFIIFSGGVVLLLARFGIMSALPEVPAIIIQSLLIVGGVLLLLDGLLGANNQSSGF